MTGWGDDVSVPGGRHLTIDIEPGTLRVLGVGGAEERVYRALVGMQSATVAQLCARLRDDPADLVRVLSLLEDRGLVARAAGHPDRYVAAPPGVAVGALLQQHRAALRQAEEALSDLAERYRRAGGRSVGDLVEVVTGAEAVGRRLRQVWRAASTELSVFAPSAGRLVSRAVELAGAAVAMRDLRYRVVVAREVLDSPDALAVVRTLVGGGHRVRVVDRLPLGMVVADGSVALVPLSAAADAEPGAALVHSSGILTALVALFDAVWAGGMPLRPFGPEQPEPAGELLSGDEVDELDTRILSLLLVGLTDRAAAGQLGLSMRTVQRRVRRLMDLAGVQTRLQLGWYAARHDWV